MALPTASLDSSKSAALASPDLLDWPLQAAAVANAAWLPAHARVSTLFGNAGRMPIGEQWLNDGLEPALCVKYVAVVTWSSWHLASAVTESLCQSCLSLMLL